jgi:hypothetical protein
MMSVCVVLTEHRETGGGTSGRRSSKTSRTSSKPPLSDGYAKPKTLHVSSGKPPGAEQGHPCETLRLQETPDTTVIYHVAENPATPLVCSCGTALLLPTEQAKKQSTPLLIWMQPGTNRGMEGIKASGILQDYHECTIKKVKKLFSAV